VGGIRSALAGALFFEPTSHKRGGVTCRVVVCLGEGIEAVMARVVVLE
jgi:hypothetical protein